MPPLGVLGALQFLTRIPVRLRAAPDLAASVPWFPVVGAGIGVFHTGVERAWWRGPTTCTSSGGLSSSQNG